MTTKIKFFDVDGLPEVDAIKAQIDYSIVKTETGQWEFTIKEKITGKVLENMKDIDTEEDADACFIHSMYRALERVQKKKPSDFDYKVQKTNDVLWHYVLKEKSTGEVLEQKDSITTESEAYQHLCLALTRNGCHQTDAMHVMLEGQGKIKVNENGTIDVNLDFSLEGNDAVLRDELEKRGQQRLTE